jgi:4-amino-4-deoxy-L-arabinose transferase-like glycosyltransferase
MKLSFIIFLFGIILLGGILRFYNISANPPGLYIDEVSIGLNAYDILKTGKDQYGFSYPLTFKSFGDYKLPFYVYSVSLSMAIFGKTDFSVRFPSALAGTLTILVVFLLTRELLKDDKQTKKAANILALLAAAIFAILPWHIQFSRGGFEVCVGLLLYSTALFFGIRYWKSSRIWYLIPVILLLSLSEYTYHSYRIISPLTFFIVTAAAFFKEKKHFKNLLTAFIVFIFLSLPLILFSFSAQGQERLLGTSALSNSFSSIAGITKNVLIFLNNYLSYFSLTFLFHLGDQANRHQVQNFGLLYFWQLPFCIAGLYFLTKTKNIMIRSIIIFLFLIAPVAPAIALPSPQTLRSLLLTIPFTLLTGLGIYQIYLQKNKWIRFIFVITAVLALVSFVYFLNYYFVQYPKESQIDWGGGCKQIAYQIQKDLPRYDYVVVDNNLGCVHEYFSFYIPSVNINYVGASWLKPKSWGTKKVLYVRPFYGNNKPENLEKNIYIANVNHDVFAQFYNL